MLRRRALRVALVALAGCAKPESNVPSPSPAPDPAAAGEARSQTPPRPPAPKLPSEPVVTPEAEGAHAATQTAMNDGPLPEHPLVGFAPIERAPQGPAPLASFHAALRALAAGDDDDGKVRIGVYGASSTSADRYTGYLRRYLQARFGAAGPGFVALVPLWRWHRHDRVRVDASRQWIIEHAQRKKGRLDGLYGLLGASASTSNKRARASLQPKDDALRVDLVELWYLAQPGGGRLRMSVDGQEHAVSTAADAHVPGYFAPPLPEPVVPRLELRLRGDGEVRLFGAVLESAGPGVVLDNVGIGGTRAKNHLDWDETIWADGARRRDWDLYMLAYGANESIDEDEPIELYRGALTAVLARLRRTLPEASCVLVGPQDFPMRDETAPEQMWRPRPRLLEIIAIQREVAFELGCGFFDVRALMGGDDSMVRWVAADPPLAKGDHLHLTPLGYRYLGRALADALMADYDASDRARR